MVLVRLLRRSPTADSGTNELRGAPRRQWCSDPRSPWPEMVGMHSSLLSGPRKQGSKHVMDHTRRGDLARTNIKALARISKRSKGHSEGALE